jgi:glycosyltransferase involved in cell wall biosynthesis
MKMVIKEKKTLLMVSYPFPPNASAGAVRSERFARYLGEFGWSVEVITISPRKDMFEDSQRLRTLGDHVRVHFTNTWDPWLWLQRKNARGFLLRNVKSSLMKLFSFPDHMIFWTPFAILKGLKILRKKKISALYTTGPPHSSHLAGMCLSKMTGIPWVADFRDPWTLNRYHPYQGRKGIDNILLNFERLIEKGVYSKAGKVLANTKANQENVLKAFPWIGEEKIVHVPNGWEEYGIVEQLVKKDSLFTIVHSGTFYPRFKPYGLLHALAAWKKGSNLNGITPMPPIKVILLGARDSVTKRTVSDLGLDDIVEIRPWVSLEESRNVMVEADLLWTSLGTGKESATYIPSKVFEYFSAKRPIIGFFPEGETERLINETKTGVVFTSDEPSPVIAELRKAIENKNRRKVTYAPDEIALGKYEIKRITANFVGILNTF